MEIKDIRGIYTSVLKNVQKVIVGKEEVFTLLFTTILSGGHILLEDNPGTGKTTLAKCIAQSVDGTFKRVQFTPDLMPQDITGLNIYNQKDGDFHLMKGPVFTNIFLADEINRATPRTQSALLEAMEEKTVTIDGETMKVPEPFLVIATENPIETSGTYPLPEAQLDRFMMKLTMGSLDHDQEAGILARFMKDDPLKELGKCCTVEDILKARETVKCVKVKKEVMDYIVDISEATRHSSKIIVGVSPRASLLLMRAAMSFAAISGRNYVTPDDVKYLAPHVFAHRILTASGLGRMDETRKIISDLTKTITAPVEDWSDKKNKE